jgi:hypothetical protein
LSEVGPLGGKTEPARDKGADQRDFQDAHDGRDGGAQIQPDAQEDDGRHGEDAAGTHGPPGAERIFTLEVGRRQESEITKPLEQRVRLRGGRG